MSGAPRLDWQRGLPPLRGPGVTLREPVLDDAAGLVAMLATASVGRFMNRSPACPRRFAAFIEWARVQRRLGRSLCYGIVPDGEPGPVGLIQARQLEPGFSSVEWGFAVGRPFWGSGLFPCAARMAIDFIFRYTGAHRLEARSAIQNGRANGALKKVGASPEGVLRQSFVVDQEPVHQVLWALRIDQWPLADPPVPYRAMQPEPDPAPVTGGELPAGADELPAWCEGIDPIGSGGFVLRELEPSDAGPLVRQLSSPDVVRYILPPPSDEPGFRRFIEWARAERLTGQYLCLGIVPEGCPHAVGIFQLHRVDPAFTIGEWGFVLAPPYWGTGLFAGSAAAFLDFVFDVVGVRRLEARSAQANIRASGALMKLGAVREGSMKRSFLLGGEYYDDYLWAILADDWDERRAA